MQTSSLLRSLIITCQFWCGISIVFLFSSLIDGILLSVATISLEFTENMFQIIIAVKSEISMNVIVHGIEVGFRIIGLFCIHGFINDFLCYEMIHPLYAK